MLHTRVVSDPDECRRIWNKVMPREYLSDLWEARDCFQRHFNRPLHFVVVEEAGKVRGLVPLSWIEESNSFGYFPGEVWGGKTWLEQNRIIADSQPVLDLLQEHLESQQSSFHLRYLLPTSPAPADNYRVDETGYLFYPGQFDNDMDNYFHLFSGKSIKRIKNEVKSFEDRGVEYRYDDFDDFDKMVTMNQDRYGDSSYFSDVRFTDSFRDLTQFLAAKGWLRVTTVLVEGEVAAVDIGSVYNDTYTLLAGGTNANFPGIAKLINLHHMRWACQQQMKQVDFLCGEFSWKPMFHLSPRPLYLLSNINTDVQPSAHDTMQYPASVPAAMYIGDRMHA